MTFSYFHGEKRPRNIGIRKKWEDKIQDDIKHLDIRDWRAQTMDREQWRDLINRNCHTKPVDLNVKEIVFNYKKRDDDRRAGVGLQKVTEILMKETDNQYRC
ncbi:unnamed protein product, partial [Didymodactylos carnosus]